MKFEHSIEKAWEKKKIEEKATYLILIFSHAWNWQNWRWISNMTTFSDVNMFLSWSIIVTRKKLVFWIHISFFKKIKKIVVVISNSIKTKKKVTKKIMLMFVIFIFTKSNIFKTLILKIASNSIRKFEQKRLIHFFCWLFIQLICFKIRLIEISLTFRSYSYRMRVIMSSNFFRTINNFSMISRWLRVIEEMKL